MKRLICEMCGSTDLVKQDGVFICQSCGTKYSVEEAKKMMIEGTVEVQGTVRIDKSKNFMNLYQMACDAIRDGNFDSAYNYSSDALIINSDEAELIGIQGLAILGKEQIVNNIPTSCVNAMMRMFNAFESSHDSFDEKIRKLSNITEYIESVRKIKSDLFDEEIKEIESQKVEYSSGSEKVAAANLALQALGGNIFTQQKAEANLDKEKAKRIHNEKLEAQIHKIKAKKNILDNYQLELNNKINSAKQDITRQKEKFCYDEYWKAHAEERKDMESKVAAYTREIESLNKQISDFEAEKTPILATASSNVPVQATLEEIKDTIRKLENTRANLGIFKGKEKKQSQLK